MEGISIKIHHQARSLTVHRLFPFVFLLLPAALAAQEDDCFPPEDSNEAQVFAIFGVPLAFGPADAPVSSRPWSFRFGIEASYLPNIDDETATPTVCRPGKGPENVNLATLLPRPRVAIGLPAGFGLELSWVPPIEISGAEPNLVGFALSRAFPLGRSGMLLGARLHATAGRIKAAITCNEDALADPISECFGGTESEDRYHPNNIGADLAIGWSLGGGRVRPFMGTGVNLLRPRFQVDFTNQFGEIDNRRVEVDLERVVLFAGASWYPIPRLGVTGQIYSAPSDAVTGRLTVSFGS
jgi:hypothetical protein